MGVKFLEEYPDHFHSAILKQMDISKSSLEAVVKRFGLKQNDEIFLTVMIKGGWGSDDWGAYDHQDLSTLKTAKTKEEEMKLLKGMEMKMVAIDYDGKISFPKEKKKD